MRKITLGVVHCSDTPSSMDIGANEIDSWHKSRGWDGIGYHVVIRRDGSFEKGREYDVVGAHAAGFNANSLGVCLVGGTGGFNFTSKQMKSLWFLMDELETAIPGIKWSGHCDLPGVKKTCPEFDVGEWRK